jgi:hypothetical protein
LISFKKYDEGHYYFLIKKILKLSLTKIFPGKISL